MLLAIETSCDDTSVAVVHRGRVLSNIVSSQRRLHAEYGGVVPELAARAHLRNFLPVAQAALREAGASPPDLEAIAATQGPGLPNALMVGFTAGQSIAFALRRPFLGIHHHEAHLYSPWISGDPPAADFTAFQPNVSLVVSGGHTLLVHVFLEGSQGARPADPAARGQDAVVTLHRVLGSTLDDAAGECFDKVAKLLGLPYPGGPELDRLAAEGNPAAYEFPRPLLREATDDFSFAGLKTSVRYFLQKHPDLLNDPRQVRDLCASVQAAIVEVLVAKTMRAAKRLGVGCVTASGGVSCNRALRRELAAACRREGLVLRLSERSLCTDNAAMIGILAERKFQQAPAPASFAGEISPRWTLA